MSLSKEKRERYRYCGFTLHKSEDSDLSDQAFVDKYKEHIVEVYENNQDKIRYIIFQFEATELEKLHAQGYIQFANNPLDKGSYKELGKTYKGKVCKKTVSTGIKGLMELHSVHIHKINAKNKMDAINYCKKVYNKCKLHKHTANCVNKNGTSTCTCHECKCDYFDLTKYCSKCNEECVQYRTLARWDKSIDPLIGWTELGVAIAHGKGIKKDLQDAIMKDREVLDASNYKIVTGDSTAADEIVNNVINGEHMNYSMISAMKAVEKTVNKKKIIKQIIEKQFFPHNFFFYGDSNTGKTTIASKFAKLLSDGGGICYKAKDPEYCNEYENQSCIVMEEFKYNSIDYEELLNICERDPAKFRRKHLPTIVVVSKFNILTSNLAFEEIYDFSDTYEYKGKQKKNPKHRKALFRRFKKSPDYSHGYIINLCGDYFDGCVEWKFIGDCDANEFVDGRFDIKFFDDISLEEAGEYVYDHQIPNLYLKDENVYLKVEIDILDIIGGYYEIVGNSLFVYNKYCKDDKYKVLKQQFTNSRKKRRLDSDDDPSKRLRFEEIISDGDQMFEENIDIQPEVDHVWERKIQEREERERIMDETDGWNDFLLIGEDLQSDNEDVISIDE